MSPEIEKWIEANIGSYSLDRKTIHHTVLEEPLDAVDNWLFDDWIEHVNQIISYKVPNDRRKDLKIFIELDGDDIPIVILEYEDKESDADYNKRVVGLGMMAQAKLAKEKEKREKLALKKLQKERELYQLLKEKYG